MSPPRTTWTTPGAQLSTTTSYYMFVARNLRDTAALCGWPLPAQQHGQAVVVVVAAVAVVAPLGSAPARLLRLFRAPWQCPSSAPVPPQGPLAVPQLDSCGSSGPAPCASSGRAWRPRAARHSRGGPRPLGSLATASGAPARRLQRRQNPLRLTVCRPSTCGLPSSWSKRASTPARPSSSGRHCFRSATWSTTCPLGSAPALVRPLCIPKARLAALGRLSTPRARPSH